MDTQGGMSRNTGPGLYEFLMEAELQQYYPGIRGDLKVQTTAQLKYVTEEDLNAIGMSKPEMRRLKKYFQKHFPQNYLSKFKKMLLPKREEQVPGALGMLPEERQDRPPVRVPNKHMIPADAIIVNKELGTGEFGVVQQGVWTNDGERIQVAIKCLSRERMQNNPIEFLKEAAIMHAIDHEHIVRLYGVVLDTNSLMLVTELAPLRSLLECLKEPSLRASFPVLSLCDFAVQIADGMQYLEAKRLIHRDLAARNILVFSKNKVKISDFGLSRALGVGKDYYQTNFNVNLKLPIAWCAPECISYLKFTSASDVWAYGVTLWEMFSYGFQPWAALTGHQILEAIDEPNFQRLEQPDCCPKDYFSLMQQCWQHEPTKRPKFSELINLLPDLKPEQVQAVQDSAETGQLVYRQGDVITVLDKGSSNTLWKGVLNNGKTGLFNPAHTIAYLGSNLPSNKPGEFTRGDGKNAFSSQRRKIRTDMISSPQGDFKHTGHVGLDGAYFGDISFLGGKYPHLPRQVVTPYKPQEDATDNSSQFASQDARNADTTRESIRDSRSIQHVHHDTQSKHESLWSDTSSDISHLGAPSNTSKQSMISCMATGTDNGGADHEYHEISDEENQDSPLRFDKPLNFDFGPSLLDEMDQMFRSMGSSPPPPPPGHPLPSEHDSSNARNELREIQAKQCNKKKQATVKPISAADQKTLYSAIAMAQELTARSMTDLEHPPESPRTPASPSRRRKFSFKLPHQHSPKPDRRHFSEEAASIPDIQWLCSSLQSLSSTVSSIESLGAPSTLKLPLWDKASAEFYFAKSRDLLTKPGAWDSYADVDLDARILDSAATKQSLVKSTEFLETRSRRCGINPENAIEIETKTLGRANGKLPYGLENSFEFSREQKRVSTSYVDRYFEQPKYYEDDGTLGCPVKKVSYFAEERLEKLEKLEKINNLEQPGKTKFYSGFQEHSPLGNERMQLHCKISNCEQTLKERNEMFPISAGFEGRPEELANFDTREKMGFESPRGKSSKFDSPRLEKLTSFDLGTRPKVTSSLGDAARMNFAEMSKIIDQQKARAGKVPFPGRNPAQEAKAVYGSSDSIKVNFKSAGPDSPRGNLEAVRINIQSFRKAEQGQNGHESYPFVISSNPLFIAETEKKESPMYSSSESLRANFQRLRRKSDVEANNQTELNSKLLAEKYQREVSGLESVKSYLDSKKGQGLNLGLGKLTQNMIQLGKNIAQNSRNLEASAPKSVLPGSRNPEMPPQSQSPLRNVNVPVQKPKHLDLNIPLQAKPQIGTSQRRSMPGSPGLHQHILEPPKLYQNEAVRKDPPMADIAIDKATLSDEAKEVYNNLVEAPIAENTTDTNPLRMLRSGLPVVRPRVRGNKHATLGHVPAHSDDPGEQGFHFDSHHHGARTLPKTLPKIRVPPPPNAPPPVPQTRGLERHNSASEIENNQNRNNVDENPIPLPPRDRSKTLQPKSSLPRHQRKHPLIIPGGGVTRTLAKMAVVTPPVEDQVDGHSAFFQQEPGASQNLERNENLLHPVSVALNSPEEFEQRIDSELAALDSLPVEESRLHRCSVISEDLLEFSDNLIDCEVPELRQVIPEMAADGRQSESSSKLQRKTSTESRSSSMSSASKCPPETLEASDVSGNSTPTSFNRSEDSSGSQKAETSNHGISGRSQSSTGRGIGSSVSRYGPCNFGHQGDRPRPEGPVTGPANTLVNSTSSAARTQGHQGKDNSSVHEEFRVNSSGKSCHLAGDRGTGRTSDLSRQSDHVSCEDLLEFACDGPNARRTRGPRNGEQSDEVRIMLKVLHEQSTPESCVAALNVTDWDVLAAIKLERLQGLLKKENNFVGLEDCKVMLTQCGGDVVKAAALLRNTEDTAAV